MKKFIFSIFTVLLPALAFAALTNNGSVATCGTTTPGTTCIATLSNAIEINRLGLVRIGFDNLGSTNGFTDTISGITDSVGNATYQKLCEYTNANGGAGNGATSALWVGRAAVAIPVSGTITVTFNTTVNARVVQVQEITPTVGNSLQLAGTCKTENIVAIDAGSMTSDTLPSKEYLFVRNIALEARTDALSTPTTNFATYTQSAIDGGTTATSMTVMGEWDILTGTTATSNPTLSSSARDGASIFVALEECTPPACGAVAPPAVFSRPAIIVQ